MNSLRESSCDKHRNNEVVLYCHDCNENICLTCLFDNHKQHNTAEIREAADNFKQSINDDDEQILSAISSVRQQSGQTKLDATELVSVTGAIKMVAAATGDVVKRSVDDQVNDVLMKLDSVTSESSKEAESVQEAYQQAVVSMESFHTRSRELVEKGRPSDATEAASKLHDRATDLLSVISTVTALQLSTADRT